jgi:hypothetical protein
MKITGLDAGADYQYRINTPNNWIWSEFTAPAGGDSPEFLFNMATDTCYVRRAATTTAPASFTATLTTGLVIQSVYFPSYVYGATPAAATITISNKTDANITFTSLTVENATHYTLQGSINSVPAGGTNTSRTLTAGCRLIQ